MPQLALAAHHEALNGQCFHAHRAVGMQAGGGNADFRTQPELAAIVGRIGNSITAINKEATQQRANALPKPAHVPPAAVIASATATEQAVTEIGVTAPTS